MTLRNRSTLRASLLVGCALLAVPSVFLRAQGHTSVPVSVWLVLGPVPARAAAFSAANDSASLASARVSIEHGWPAAGQVVNWLDNSSTTWVARDVSAGPLRIASSATSAIVYAVSYLDADRYTRAKLNIDGVPPARRSVSLDGVRVSADSVTLRRGKHLLMVQLFQPADTALSLAMRLDASVPAAQITAGVDPRHNVTLGELMKTADVNDVAVDPTGQRVAWVVRRFDEMNDRSVTTLEIHDLATGRLLTQLNGADASAPSWSRDGARLAFLTATDKKGSTGRDLWVWDAAKGQSERMLRGERGLSPAEWSANGDWIYYTSTAHLGAPEAFSPGDAQRLTEVWDRWSFWPEKAQLNALNLKAGTSVKLVGDTMYSVEGAKLSPDGRHIVFARSIRVPTGRPWLRAEIWQLDLNDVSTRKLLDLPHEAFGAPTYFAWSADGNAVAFCASAAETLTSADSTFSVYESELYAINIKRPSLVRLSGGFVPAVSCNHAISWNPRDQRIYVIADAGARTIAARTSGPVPSSLDRQPPLEAMATPGEAITANGFGATVMVAAAQTPTTPPAVYRIPLNAGSPAVLLDQPSATALAGPVAMPSWRSWEFTNSKGARIEGWYWLPPGFDSTRTYPMIVHYYGGTLPMKKAFDQRLLWFASNGYVVFMLNPAGTPGYGQQFANLHINDWGFPAGTDIIEGVQQFERAHAFVDSRHVGNFGHSYGGFMTMHLATRTNLFTASISIAGISNIPAYWGAGWTGYSYTEGTCPGCYPWNRKDVFVDRSPLFQADRIHSPLLLIHGTADTNVPTNESEQMFTALKMLGLDAEYVRIYGENHGINSRPSVTNTLYGTMLDWYDSRLRGQPDAWNARWITVPKPAAVSVLPATP